jgi:hypothetical protein
MGAGVSPREIILGRVVTLAERAARARFVGATTVSDDAEAQVQAYIDTVVVAVRISGEPVTAVQEMTAEIEQTWQTAYEEAWAQWAN